MLFHQLIFLFVATYADTITCADVHPYPIDISNHDIQLQVGENSSVSIFSTETFEKVFQNVSQASLVFHVNPANAISGFENITLIDDDGEKILSNTTLELEAVQAARTVVTSELSLDANYSLNYTAKNIFVRIAIYKVPSLLLVSDVVGWIYFFLWSISFYPQIVQNYKRKSVRGLSLDFVILNTTGFILYSLYNLGLYFFNSIQESYFEKYPAGIIPVQLNDVVFSTHAVFACLVTLFQCYTYEKGSQTVSSWGTTILFGIFTLVFIMLVVAATSAVTWLTFLMTCSYVKLFVTLIKYVPQAYMNWTRKSTSGWSIGNVLLDFSGGVFSTVQMIIISYNHNDWGSFFGDFTKFGLGMFSILFDIFFMVQHYVLYRNHAAYEPIEGATIDNNTRDDLMVTSTSNQLPSTSEGGNGDRTPHSSESD